MSNAYVILLATVFFSSIAEGSCDISGRKGNIRGRSSTQDLPNTYEFARSGSNVTSDGRDFHLFAVRGHGKSGTNWVRNVLNLHPEINCIGEMNIDAELHVRSLFPSSTKEKFPDLPTIQSKQWFFRQYEKAVEEGGKDLYARLVLEASQQLGHLNSKTDTNGELLEDVHVVGEHSPQKIGFPFIKKLPTIYIVRDGRDVIVSWAFHLLNMCIKQNNEECDLYDSIDGNLTRRAQLRRKMETHKADPQHFINNPQDLFTAEDSFWVRALARSWQSFKENHKHYYKPKGSNDETSLFESTLFENGNSSVYTIFYEKLHNDTVDEVKKMHNYLGLNPESAEAPSARTRTLPGNFKNKGNSFYRKGSPGTWKRYASETFLTSFNDVAGDALRYYGYDRGDNAKIQY